MKKFAIYTAVIGEYDNIRQPLAIDDRFDYFLFSNAVMEQQVGVWRVKPLDYHNDDRTRVARWVKTHPEELLPNYEFTVWVDANIQIADSFIYKRSIALHNEGTHIASMWHHERECAYDEAIEVLAHRLDHELKVVKWVQHMKCKHFPIHQGLYETNVLYRSSDAVCPRINELWWQCINDYSRRDQLSFTYVLWKIGVECPFLLGKGENTRNSVHFVYINHTAESVTKQVQPNRKMSPFLSYYIKSHPNYSLSQSRAVYTGMVNSCLPVIALRTKGIIERLRQATNRFCHADKNVK